MKNSMSRRGFLAVAGVSALALAGCGSSDEDEGSAGSASSEAETAEEEAEPQPPELVETGYSIIYDSVVQYGVCWTNPNSNYEIQYPVLKITGYDADGGITFADEQIMNFLQPGETQYFACSCGGIEGTVSAEFSVSELEDYNFVESSEELVEYYTISNTNVVDDGYGSLYFTGEITTNVELEDYSEAWLSVILRDDSGAIVYGSNGFVTQAAEGETTAFEVLADEPPEYASYEIYAMPAY